MNEISLKTNEQKQLSFVGELISESTSCVEFADGFARQFTLALYAIESGGFVPAIVYTSDHPEEQTGRIAEIVDLFKDVENFFFVFVASDVLPRSKPVEREQCEARKKLETKLRLAYEDLTSTFLEEVSERLDSTSELETTDANEASAES